MIRKTVITHTLGDQLVGQFAEEDGLDTDATLAEALEYGFVTSMQKEALLAQIQGVFKAMIRGVEAGGARPQWHLKRWLAQRRWKISFALAKSPLNLN